MKDTALSMFLPAWLSPRICDRSFSDTASPDASSPPLLIRIPVDSFSMSLFRSSSLNLTTLFANIALKLWLIIM